MKKRVFETSDYLTEVDDGILQNIIINDLIYLNKINEYHTCNYYFLVEFLLISEYENEYKSQFIIWFDLEDLKLANVNENNNDELENMAYYFAEQYISEIPNIKCRQLMFNHDMQIIYYQKKGIL